MKEVRTRMYNTILFIPHNFYPSTNSQGYGFGVVRMEPYTLYHILFRVDALMFSESLTTNNHLWCLLFVWFEVLHPSQQLWSCRDSQFT